MFTLKITFLGMLLGLSVLASPAAHAQVDFHFQTADQTGMPGSLLHFSGTAANIGVYTVYLNGDTPAFNAAGLMLDDSPFAAAAAASPLNGLGAGNDTYSGGVFDITLDSQAAPGTYYGSFDILGGVDASEQTVLATQNFSVTVSAANPVPETSSSVGFGVLMALGLGGLIVSAKRRKSTSL